MEITTLCAVVAALRIRPNRSQFFQYESVSLSCGQQGNSSEWSVKRNTSTKINQECFNWDKTQTSHCFIDALYPSDTGVYWCQSAAGGCSDTVRITVTGGPVILESPVCPVVEGEDVTLSCRRKKTTSIHTADFYKDGFLIRSSSTGDMTIHSVSKSDEGLYRCNISGAGLSPHSWLSVTAGHPAPPDSRLADVPLSVVVVCVSLVSLVSVTSLCLCRSLKGKVDPDVSYTDVTIMQEVQLKRVTDVDSTQTFYSTVRPGDT